jgi:succinate dehydrogenase / fumarate reductase flavoprotein subunit
VGGVSASSSSTGTGTGTGTASAGIDARRDVGAPLEGGAPAGPTGEAWAAHKLEQRLVNPANRRRFRVIVVGTGLAGAGCAATLGELGYGVDVITLHDSPRRAHSVAAQGGVNASRGARADNDAVERFFRDTLRGGDFRSREADVHRLAELSAVVIDHCAAQGIPFAREYGGALATRSFGGVQVSRTYYARSQTGQQLQLGSYQALMRQVAAGTCRLHPRTEMLDLIVSEGRAVGVVTRDLVTGEIRPWTAHAVVLATGGYGTVYFTSTLAKASNATAAWRAHRRGAAIANPSFVQFHPTSLPMSSEWQSKSTLMSESLRNDGRVWVPVRPGDDRAPGAIPEDERDYYLERKYPSYGNLAPRDISSRAAKEQLDAGRGVGPLRNGVYLDFADAIARVGRRTIRERYGNLFALYEEATGDSPWTAPMRIAPGPHFTMGGLWVDYDAMSTIPGLFVGGEASVAYHGANRLGANSLLSASVDGYFVLPFTVAAHLAPQLGAAPVADDHPDVVRTVADVEARIRRLVGVGGRRGADVFHRELGAILRDRCGVTRSAEGLASAADDVRALRAEFWSDLRVPGDAGRLNQELERAGRVADFLELAELMCIDALDREESCGAHFRVEHQTAGGEAQRDDERWASVSGWETPPGWGEAGATARPVRRSEPLTFRALAPETRSYA